MANRFIVPLPDGRWLALGREAFAESVAAGAELRYQLAPTARVSSTPDQPEELLTAGELAKCLKLSRSWIEQATREGRLPCHEFGRYRRYSLAAVIEAAKQEPKSSPLNKGK